MLDCCNGNICLYNNTFYVFDFDQYADANIYNCSVIRVNDNHTAYWTIDTGYKKYNKMIDSLFKNNNALHKKYTFHPEYFNNHTVYK